ncbi:adenylate/guanylate cyclase domain-containing protein [Sphingobacterium sp. UGAL515B_05]|uniref:adenylate/guanylate cyclase domain-containing protein n=1 Tax=Sphingobacterium sp. UGAL515B_05 TaxID=2986767 RepID=UPI0029529992|nr:adenylate/guanylate cyclase domain-containing protein [Sphingobacterium sp. UGAL515B_05]WON94778.1 adenylate/guanylate cyclase domain-containing protein [Sphingobacterium sp. UGAL515B_05]
MEEKDKKRNLNSQGNARMLSEAERLSIHDHDHITPLEYYRMVTKDGKIRVIKTHRNEGESIFDSSSETKINIEEEILNLKRQLLSERDKLHAEQGDKKELLRVYKELESKQKSSHIISRIHSEAVSKYLSSKEFRSQFEHGKETFAVVVSIDIRRSTELMLKAKNPTEYSDFITGLSDKLSKAIINNFGIFDKFTGDGILAFFPKFYSGEEAVLRALIAAEECHAIFDDHYKSSRDKFTVFIKDVGLGVGIDCGTVSIANTSSELTVVGRPVVYACRFSGAKAGDTLLNLEPYEQLINMDHPMIKDIEESEIHIKNEGVALAFKVRIDSNKYEYKTAYPWDVFKDDKTPTQQPEDIHREMKDKKGA